MKEQVLRVGELKHKKLITLMQITVAGEPLPHIRIEVFITNPNSCRSDENLIINKVERYYKGITMAFSKSYPLTIKS